ncbi:MAG: hypothetical protein M3P16_03670 [Chloroflexota bacterium]|nr:hypothetical protein [Chloroflexota bacterium]
MHDRSRSDRSACLRYHAGDRSANEGGHQREAQRADNDAREDGNRVERRADEDLLQHADRAEPYEVGRGFDDRGSPLPIAENVSDGIATIAQRFDPTLAPIIDLPRLDLAIGRSRLFALLIETGASENTFDLGGLPITAFELKANDVFATAVRHELDTPLPRACALSYRWRA